MQSSGSLPAKSDDGVGDLTVNEVDATVGKAMAHSSENHCVQDWNRITVQYI